MPVYDSFTTINTSTTTATTGTGDGVWTAWNDTTSSSNWATGIWPTDATTFGTRTFDANNVTYRYGPAPAPLTQQELDERLERLRVEVIARDGVNLKLRLRHARERRRIRANASGLLRTLLTADQWKEYRRFGSVRVAGKDHVYEVGGGRGWEGMIYKLDFQGVPVAKLCCHPSHDYPTEDRVAAVVLALRSDEDAVIREANVHQFREHEKERVKLRRAFRSRAA